MTPMKKEWEEDQTWIALDTGTHKIVLGVLYFRPVGEHCEEGEMLEKMQALTVRILELQDKNYEIMVVGDFNAKIEESVDGYYGTNSAGQCLIDTTVLAGMEVLNFNPITMGKYILGYHRVRGKTKQSRPSIILYMPLV